MSIKFKNIFQYSLFGMDLQNPSIDICDHKIGIGYFIEIDLGADIIGCGVGH